MATLAASSMQPYNNTDALFRTWCQYVHDTLALAWVQTADTGQINLGSVAKPAAANTKQGYEIWRMADTLQATAPCYLRIDYGSGSVATYPGLWLTVGTGSDGSGNITGVLFNGGGTTAPTTVCTGSATAANSYGSADTNRVAVLIAASGVNVLGFGIERTKDANGGDTADGFLTNVVGSYLITRPTGLSGSSSNGRTCLHYTVATGAQPPFAMGWQYVLFNENPSAFSSDVGIGLPIPLGTVAKQPGTNFAVCRSSDFVLEAAPVMTIYGVSVTYVRTGMQPGVGLGNSSSTDSTAAVLMRYD